MRKEVGQSGWLGLGRKLFWSWWLWVAVAIIFEGVGHGNFAAGFAGAGLILYLAAPHEQIPRYGLKYAFPVDSKEFLTTVAGAAGATFVPNNKVTILNNGDAFYPAMLDAIRNAKRTITMETYIYWAGDIGRQFAFALAERRCVGVQVKLLLDAIGSSTIGKEILHILRESGCAV